MDKDRMADVIQLERVTTSSVELQRAKDGTYYWTVKIYFEIGQELATLERLADIDRSLRNLFLKGE